ncbi:MAG: MutS protein msh4 [Icmadophila ericetorum]|nr:MutS protein msh4 [Icmadophila ericetorum]
MASIRGSTSYSTTSTSPSSQRGDITTPSRPSTSWTSTSRPKTRATTAASTRGYGDQQIICAVTESRGVSPTVGLAFVNITTTEAVICQIVDNQTYVRTLHKLMVFEPTALLFPDNKKFSPSKLYSIIETNIPDLPIILLSRKFWGETTGIEYVERLAFMEDVQAIKISIGGNFYATCCLAATLKYIELTLSLSFPFHSMRIKYEPSEGSMMIDFSTIHSLELVQNLQSLKSRDCLFGLLNQTLTPMGSRLLRSNILQPLTEADIISKRYDALAELATKEEIFFATRQALKSFFDVDRTLTKIIIIPSEPSIQHSEQSINNVILLKQYIKAIPSVFEALLGAQSELLTSIRQLCAPEMIAAVRTLIDNAINEDVTYQSKPLDLRNQRTYAVKSGVNGLLDVARQTYDEACSDAAELCQELSQEHDLTINLKFEYARQFYFEIPQSELENRNLPGVFINMFKKKKLIECQTLNLVKGNQRLQDSHHEVLQMSDQIIQELIDRVREDVAPLSRISEGVAMLDLIAALAQTVTTQDYCRPELTPTLAIKDGRHPIREKIHSERFVPNDVYACEQSRFQVITGCNMSGKSTYIRSIALMQVMAQIGSFVPASYASFPIVHQLFARLSMDDSIEANVSTFAAEMRETAFILHNIDNRSLVIIDELGRGTSTRDGLAIAIAIAEALVESRAFVWFATHFRDLARFMAERSGVVNMHLAVETSQADRMMMLYKVASGYFQEEHYGIALARVIDLPPLVIEVAEIVSAKLTANRQRKKKNNTIIVQARRRKLILGLREQLIQARDGQMQGAVLRTWLKQLQDEFVRRMAALDEEASAVVEDEGEGEEEEKEPKSKVKIKVEAGIALERSPRQRGKQRAEDNTQSRSYESAAEEKREDEDENEKYGMPYSQRASTMSTDIDDRDGGEGVQGVYLMSGGLNDMVQVKRELMEH